MDKIMKKIYISIIVIWTIFVLFSFGWAGTSDPVIEGKPITGKISIGDGKLEIPNSTTLPGTCVVGEIYMDTDATSGQRCYLCESTNSWVLQGDGGGGTVSTSGTPVANDFARFTDANTIEGRSYSEVKTDLGLVIGTDVQASDAGLTSISWISETDGVFLVGNGAAWVAESGGTARESLGLGTAATRAAEDTLSDGANLPDGHAIKTYGDANWGGAGSDDWDGTTIVSPGSASSARTTLELGSAALRAAEDTMTNGGNLPDGAAIKAYGDSNWGGGGSLPSGVQGDMLYKGSSSWLALAGTYNVKAYGATGNGTTDDTTAIQNAINAAEAAGGGQVYFPPGTYLINSGPLIVDNSYVTLIGDLSRRAQLKTSLNKVILQLGLYTYTGSDDFNCGVDHVLYPAVVNLTFYHSGTANTAIEVRAAKFGTFSNLLFSFCDIGIVIKPISVMNQFDNILAHRANCTIKIDGSGYSGNYNSCANVYRDIKASSIQTGGYVFYAIGVTFGDFILDGVQAMGGASNVGYALIYLKSTGAHYYRQNFQLSNMDCDGFFTYGIRMEDCKDFQISGGIFGGAIGTETSFINCTNYNYLTENKSRINKKLDITNTGSASCGTMKSNIDNSSDWWTDGKATYIINNTHSSGDATLKMVGTTTAHARIVYGAGTTSDKLFLAPRKSASAADTYSTTIDHLGNGVFPGTVTASCGTLTCDYVFEDDYDLMSLDDLQKFTETEKTLPGMTINEGGVFSTATLREELVEKTEEQALYILQLHERLKKLEERLDK